MNIILDTNAIKYFYQIKTGESVNICLNGKKINNNKFVNLCENAQAIFVMSESYFELFFQSYKKERNLTEFESIDRILSQSIKNNGGTIYTINDTEGFYFDINKLVHSINYGEEIHLNDYIGTRIEQEKKLMHIVILVIIYALTCVVFDCVCDVCFPKEYIGKVQGYIKQELEKLYVQYYIDMELEIKEFEKELDALIYDVLIIINNNIDIFSAIKKNTVLPHTNGYKSGAEYTAKLLKNLKKFAKEIGRKSATEMFEEKLDEFIYKLKEEKGYTSLKIDYLKYLCKSFAKGRRIKKNDITDYAMITSLDIKEVVFQNMNIEETVFISFDNYVNAFCKDKGILYREDIFDVFCE